MRQGSLFARNVAVLLSGELLSRGLTFVAFARLARLLEPASYGQVEVALAAVMFATLVVDLGLSTLGTRDIAARRADVPRLIRQVVSAQLLLAIVVYPLLALLLIGCRVDASLTQLLLGFAVSIFGLPFLLYWVFQGRNHMTPVAVLQVLRQSVFVAMTFIVVRAPAHLFRLPWAEILAVAVAAAGYVALLRRSGESPRVNLRAGCDLQLLREGLPIGGSQLVWASRMYLPIILLAACSGQAVIGFFGAAHRMVMVGQTLLTVYFATLFPVMSEASFRSADALAALLRRSMRWVLWPMVALAAMTTVAAPPVMRLVFGSQFAQASTTLAVLVWVLPMLAWRRHHRNALIALNHQGEELACSLFGLAVLVWLTLQLGSRYGAVGGAWAMVISELAGAVVTWWRLKRHLPAYRLPQPAVGGAFARHSQ